jgi:hypothetical protein
MDKHMRICWGQRNKSAGKPKKNSRFGVKGVEVFELPFSLNPHFFKDQVH